MNPPGAAVGPSRPATKTPNVCNLRPPEMRNIRPALTVQNARFREGEVARQRRAGPVCGAAGEGIGAERGLQRLRTGLRGRRSVFRRTILALAGVVARRGVPRAALQLPSRDHTCRSTRGRSRKPGLEMLLHESVECRALGAATTVDARRVGAVRGMAWREEGRHPCLAMWRCDSAATQCNYLTQRKRLRAPVKVPPWRVASASLCPELNSTWCPTSDWIEFGRPPSRQRTRLRRCLDQISARTYHCSACLLTGNFLILCLVAAKIALVSAGMIPGTPYSPTPAGCSPELMIVVSMCGASRKPRSW